MTSKEALDYMYIISICNSGNDETTDKVCEGYNKIADDLEVLDIIKTKCLTNCNLALVKDNLHYHKYCKEFEYFLNKWNTSPNGFEITKEDLLTQEEFELIKEWLENEK